MWLHLVLWLIIFQSPATLGNASVEEVVVDATMQGTGGEERDGGGRVSTRAILQRVDNNDDTAGEPVETPATAGGGADAQVPGPGITQTGAINLNNVGNSIGNTTTYHINLNLNPNPISSPTPDETQTCQPTTQDDAESDPSRNTRSERRRRQRQCRRNADTSLPREGPYL
ncbi:hypothetical protein BJ165DRAFT_1410674 [Panaeolus papilionaceus]|nr:hypothetical protein BJ165DRAFT_1410674 [Panaeolus papilionaceus]